ncbi:MAG TPA: sugar ABC transporter permease [Acetobacteraceae bacterium]|nr:sugar ABC transporter permease [Acetobacteraceae bacterium]
MRRFGVTQWLMLAPAQALLWAAIALPALYVLWLSVTDSSYGSGSAFVGLQNYLTIWQDGYFWRALTNTLIVIHVVIYAELVLALGLAVAVAGVRRRRLLISIILMPYAISEVVAVIIWKFLMDPNAGIVARTLTSFGSPTLHWASDPDSGLALVSLVSIWLHLPFSFMLVFAAMLAVPKEQYEAASVDGAQALAKFRHVTLPAILPAMLVALVFRYILAFRLFSEVWLLTGGGPARRTEVLAIYLYKQAFTYADFGAGAATGWLMVVVSLLFAVGYVRLLHGTSFARR